MTTKAETAISRARASLILDRPFYGMLALRLQPKAVTADEWRQMGGRGLPTMAVDGKHLFYEPGWVETLTRAQMVGLIAHEICHLCLLHHCRRGNRDPGNWNLSCDFAVDPLLKQDGLTLPAGEHIDPRYAGMAAEQIYAMLPVEPPSQGGGQGEKSPGKAQDEGNDPGQVWDAPGEDGTPASAAELAAAKSEWEVAVLQAAQTAKGIGKVPGFVSEMAKAIRAPEIDWKDALRRYVRTVSRDDYSFRRPNPRHLANGDWFPSLANDAIGEIVLAVDTSGSVGRDELAAFAAELNGILDEACPQKLHAVFCDMVIQGEREYSPDDYPVVMPAPGRGGTAFSPVWDWVRDREIDPVCAIYLTDLDATDFGDDPGYPVLWVSTRRDQAPFGEVVRLRV